MGVGSRCVEMDVEGIVKAGSGCAVIPGRERVFYWLNEGAQEVQPYSTMAKDGRNFAGSGNRDNFVSTSGPPN